MALQVAGRALDGRWHANHDEFEGASQQLEAHWLIWLGVLVTLVVCSLAVRRLAAGDRERAGYVLTLVSALAYTPVAVWHFVEHANGNDRELAHVLLALAQAGMIIGFVLVLVRARQPQRTG